MIWEEESEFCFGHVEFVMVSKHLGKILHGPL